MLQTCNHATAQYKIGAVYPDGLRHIGECLFDLGIDFCAVMDRIEKLAIT